MVVTLGSHIHKWALKAPMSKEYQYLDIKLLVTPSITPYYTNNPGYTLLELEKSDNSVKMKEATLYFY